MKKIRFLNLLLLFCLLPIVTMGQDTLALEPISQLPVRNILTLENDRLIAAKYFSQDGVHAWDSVFVYDISNPTEPFVIDCGFPVQHGIPLGPGGTVDPWHTDAVILDSLIVTCTTYSDFFEDIPPFTRVDGPVKLLGRWIGAEENLWEIVIQEEIVQEGLNEPYDGDNYEHPGNMAIFENFLILAAGSWGVRIYDLSNPEEPELAGVLDYFMRSITLIENRLLVSEGNNLILLDISDPQAPERIGELEIGNEEYPYEVSGNVGSEKVNADGCVFLKNDDRLLEVNSLLVLDLMADNSPVEVGRFNLDRESQLYEFQVSDGKLCIKDRMSAIVDIYNLTDNFDIEYSNTFSVSDVNYGQFFVRGDVCFFSGKYSGAQNTLIYDIDPDSAPDSDFRQQPTSFILYPAYPNPFNATTTINYNLPVQSNVSLQVYNIRGQLVDVLLDGVMPAGRHSVVWNAGEIGAGVYFARMGGDGQVFTKKIILIR